MPNTNPITKDTTNNVWPYEITINSAGYSATHTFTTENKFLDANIAVKAYTPSADISNNITLNLTGLTNNIDMGTVSGGYYYPVADLSGVVNINAAGWIISGDKNVTDTGVALGKVIQSILQNGNTTIDSGTRINPTDSTQTLTISAGYYNTARTLTIGSVADGPKGTITSGSAQITSVTYNAGTDANTFVLTGSANVSAPTVNTAGYVSSNTTASIGGTKNANVGGATLNAIIDKILGNTTFSGTATYVPEIEKVSLPSGVTNAATNDNSTTTAPTSSSTNAWIAIKSEANTGTLTATPNITTAGYGTATKHGITANSTTVGAAESQVTYVKIKSASIKTPDATPTIGNPIFQTSGTYQNQFTIEVSGDIDKPTITTEGYIKANGATDVIGARTGGSITTTTKALTRVTVGADITGTTTLNHNLSKGTVGSGETWTNAAASGNAVTTTPSSGVYIKVSAAALSTSISATGKVTSAGYGGTTYTTGNQQYIKATAASATISAAAAVLYVPVQESGSYSLNITQATGSSNVAISSTKDSNNKYTVTANNLSITGTLSAGTAGWFTSGGATDTDVDNITAGKIPEATFTINGGAVTVNTGGYVPANFSVTTLDTATFGNDVANGKTQDSYTDISNNANTPILISGKGLYINAGYIGDTYISLARLVPDSVDAEHGFAPANYILTGYAAWDANGAEIAGTMAIYNGTYTVT